MPVPRDLAQALDRTPPESAELEMCVLGAVMLEPREALPIAAEVLERDCFYLDGHNLLFRTMVDLWSREIMPDATAVIDELRAKDKLGLVGGTGVIMGMLNSVPTAANIEYHARKVVEKFRLRELIRVCTNGVQQAYDQQDAPAVILERTQNALARLTTPEASARAELVSGLVQQRLELAQAAVAERAELEASGKGHMLNASAGLSCGFYELDRLFSGLPLGEVLMIAGRPSMGKSALMLSMAWELAYQRQVRTGVLSLEMSAESVGDRLLSLGSYRGGEDPHWFSSDQLRLGKLTDGQQRRLERTAQLLAQAPLAIDAASGNGIGAVKARVRDMVRRLGAQVVLVDYLGLIAAGSDNRSQEIGDWLAALKALARAEGFVLIMLAQLNRAVEAEKTKRPRLSDFRDSGVIEEHADRIVFIYRDSYYKPVSRSPGQLEDVELIIGKNRNGPTGTVHVNWMQETARFLNATRRVG